MRVLGWCIIGCHVLAGGRELGCVSRRGEKCETVMHAAGGGVFVKARMAEGCFFVIVVFVAVGVRDVAWL